MKKILTALAFAALVILVFAAAAEQDAAEFKSGDYVYALLPNGTAEIVRYEGSDTVLAFPASVDGIPVTRIGYDLFYDLNAAGSVVSVQIPASIEAIESNPFCTFDSLKEITVSEDNPFFEVAGCFLIRKADNALVSCAPASCPAELTVPEGIRIIASRALACCRFTSAAIPDSVTVIEDLAFGSCMYLSSISLPDSVTKMGHHVFMFCSSLRTVRLPAHLTRIGEGTFSGCFRLAFVSIPDGVTAIGSEAFFYCTRMLSAIVPGSVTEIGERAFYGCSEHLVFTVRRDSFAEGYCAENGYSFIYPRET